MSLWKDIVRIAAPIGGALIGGPAGALLTGGAIARMLPPDKRDQFEEWSRYATELEEDDDLTNVERGDRMRGRIRKDLFRVTGEEPKERRVGWLMDTVVMAINGDFEDDERNG